MPIRLRKRISACLANASLVTRAFVLVIVLNASVVDCVGQSDFRAVVSASKQKIVKITGSGGFQGLEPYQSGIVVSGQGHILTVWSYVLDSDVVTVLLDDGQRFEAKLVGYDPMIEIAVIKIDAQGAANFNLDEAIPAKVGNRILALSNLYGVATGNEPVSVQRGIVSSVTDLSARRGAFQTNYRGQVLVVDAITNNPGAAGGAVVDRKGRLLGLIGKELRDQDTGSWLNFAIPIENLRESVTKILSGKLVVSSPQEIQKPTEPVTTELIGLVLVPNIVSRTPPFVDRVVPGSACQNAGLLTDDLIIEVNDRLTPSMKEFADRLSYIDRDSPLTFTVQRGTQFKTIKIDLRRQRP